MELTKKEWRYTTKLLVSPEFEEDGLSLLNVLKRFKGKVLRSKKAYSFNEIGRKFLGFNGKTPSDAYDYRDKLIENGVLKEVDEEEYHGNGYKKYKIDRDKLIEELKESKIYKENKELLIRILDEDGYLIIE